MKEMKVKESNEIPKNFTGIIEWASDGTKQWFKEGKRHREDGPAIEHSDGSKYWYKNGMYHREDGPAVEYADGYKEWWIEGNLHREVGPAIEYPSGTKRWFKDGNRHRLDGPAIEYSDGTKHWILEGNEFYPLNLNNFIVLDYYKGKYGIMWYKLLDKNDIFEYPDIPGLIIKE